MLVLLLFAEVMLNKYNDYKADLQKKASSQKHNANKSTDEKVLFNSELELFTSYGYDSFVAWKNQPNIKGKYINTDELGRRVTPQDNNASKTATVHFFGGSTMWGHSVTDSGTIPSQFALINKKYKVINWGEQAYNSRQELNLLLNNLNTIKKGDIVIFFDGVNDIYNNCRQSNSANGHIRHYEFSNIIKSKKTIEEESICTLNKVLKQSTIYTAVQKILIEKKIIKEQKIMTKKPSDGFIAKTICSTNKNRAIQVRDFLTNNWKAAESILRDKGVTFIPILQPNPYTAKEYTKLKQGNYMLPTKAVYPLVGEEAKKIDNYYDMSHIFKDQKYYYDCCHVNRTANKILAEKINSLIND